MSLIKKPASTEKRIAASRANARRSRGPHTRLDRERIRSAHERQGFHASAEELALRALGEEPENFEDLLEGLWSEYNPSGASQESLVIRLARSTWLMNRADRMQEGYALRQARDVNEGRSDRVHARMMRLKMTANTLRRLINSVAREAYITNANDLANMQNLNKEGRLKEMGEMALTLFVQLQEPLQYDAEGNPVGSHDAQKRVLMRIKEIFGLAGGPPAPYPGQASQAAAESAAAANPTPPPPEPPIDPVVAVHRNYPYVTAAEWHAREMARQLLENILARQVDLCEEQHQALLKETLRGPSPYERAAEIAPISREAQVLRRMQDDHFREVRRVTSLLLKIKRQERLMKQAGNDEEEPS